MKKLSAIILLLSLSACVSPQEAMINREQFESSECIQLGFKYGTAEFSNCRLQIRSIEVQKEAVEAVRETNSVVLESSRPQKCKVTHHGWTICK